MIHIDYCWEGIIEQIPLKMLHTKLHEYKIPTKNVYFHLLDIIKKSGTILFVKNLISPKNKI